MVTRDELERWLNQYLSIHTVQDYLPNGLQVEGKEHVERVALAVSISMEVIEKAVSLGADALIVHHGLFWKNANPRLTSYRKLRAKRILEADLNLFAYHLPLDFHPEISHNRRILEGIRCDDITGVEEYVRSRYALENPPADASRIGLVGTYRRAVPFTELVARLRSFLGEEPGFFDHGEPDVSSVYVVSGGGRNELDGAVRLGVDAYITGDVKEETPYVTRETGLNYVYAGHYLSEKPGMLALAEVLERTFELTAYFIDTPNYL